MALKEIDIYVYKIKGHTPWKKYIPEIEDGKLENERVIDHRQNDLAGM